MGIIVRGLVGSVGGLVVIGGFLTLFLIRRRIKRKLAEPPTPIPITFKNALNGEPPFTPTNLYYTTTNSTKTSSTEPLSIHTRSNAAQRNEPDLYNQNDFPETSSLHSQTTLVRSPESKRSGQWV
jgi:hypothetical protein